MRWLAVLLAVGAMTTACAERGRLQSPVEMELDRCPSANVDPAYPSGGVLRDHPVVVRACLAADFPVALPSAEPVTAGGQALVDLINGYDPETSVSCPSVGGRVYTLWFGYADGRAQAVVVDEGGCGTVDAGGDPLIMDSRDQVWSTYERLLSRQGD